MLHLHLVAIDELSAEVAINLMQVETMVAGKQRFDEGDVLPHLIDVAGAPRIVACGLYAS